MLVLTRKPQQSVRIGNNIIVNIVRVRGNTVQIGIEAPKDVNILRSELADKPKKLDDLQAPAIHEPPATKDSLEACDDETEAEMEFFSLELFQGPEDFDSPLQQFMFAP
jgi:carbon storage regulator CsrA